MGKLTRAERNITWINRYCMVPDGAGVGQPLVLRDWQEGLLRQIYDNPAGTRTAIISFGRKNGKTALAAALCLLHLCGPEAIQNSQLYSAAQSRDQAAVLYRLASRMVMLSPDLAPFVRPVESGKRLICEDLGTVYEAMSADAKVAHGRSPVFVVHDELGQVKGPRSELYEAMETGSGAHAAPLSVVISTQAPTDADLLSLLIDRAKKGDDPKTVLSLYTASDDADPFEEAAWKEANPAYGDFLQPRSVQEQAQQAKDMPSHEPSFRNLILNQRVEMNSPFVSRRVWQECAGPVIESFEGLPVFGGLDLSEVNDLTALVLIAPVERVWHVKPTFWLPEDGLREKARADRVQYDVWAANGDLETTPGPTVDYEYVAARLFDLAEVLDIRKIGFDRWNWRHLKSWLAKAGFSEEQLDGDAALFESVGQGFQTMSPALRDLESALLKRQISHGGHPVLEMCARNATTQTDPAGNRKLSKSKSHGRIDGMQSLAMAMSVAGTFEEIEKGPSVYEERGLLMI